MKIQIKFQKILFIVSLVLAAIALVYGFAYCTGSLSYAFAARSGQFTSSRLKKDPINADALYKFVMGKGDYDGEAWPDAGTGFNSLLVILCVVLVVIAALQFLFASNSRRNYYITNYISIGVFAVFAIVVAVIAFWGISQTEALFNDLDWVRYKEVYDTIQAEIQAGGGAGSGWDKYSDSHAIFALGYALFAIVMVDSILLVLNTVWKVLLMRGEKALLLKNSNSETIEEVAQ